MCFGVGMSTLCLKRQKNIVVTILHSTMNIGNGEDRYISLQNQQTCNSDNHNEIEEGPIFHLVLVDVSIADVLTQQQIGNLNLFNRRKSNQLTPAYSMHRAFRCAYTKLV